MRSIRFVAPVALVALAFAACGTDEKREDFVDQYNKIGQEITQLSAQSGAASADPAAASKFADQTDAVVAKLDALKPPEAAKDEFEAVKTATAKVADDLRASAEAAQSQDPEAAAAALKALATDSAALTAAENKLVAEVNKQ